MFNPEKFRSHFDSHQDFAKASKFEVIIQPPKGAPDQPTSICPVMTCVKVAGPVPVAVGLNATPKCFCICKTTLCADEPLVE